MSLTVFLSRNNAIVYSEHRLFSYRDFLYFELDGVTYRFEHGTIRNYFSKLKRLGKIKHIYTSTVALYILTGVKVGKPITSPRTRGNSHISLNYHQQRFQGYIDSLPMGDRDVHDIRLKFTVKGLWSILPMYSDSRYLIRSIDMKSNKDIILHDMIFEDHVIKTTIHRTDTVGVIVACSQVPVRLDLFGLTKLTCSLGRLTERLQRVIDEYVKTSSKSWIDSSTLVAKDPVPDPFTWIVTMWHFGRDSRISYTGELSEMSWEDALGVFHRVYSKEFVANNNKKKVMVREEIQDIPNKPLGAAL